MQLDLMELDRHLYCFDQAQAIGPEPAVSHIRIPSGTIADVNVFLNLQTDKAANISIGLGAPHKNARASLNSPIALTPSLGGGGCENQPPGYKLDDEADEDFAESANRKTGSGPSFLSGLSDLLGDSPTGLWDLSVRSDNAQNASLQCWCLEIGTIATDRCGEAFGVCSSFDLVLERDWNLISIPVLPPDPSVEAVFGDAISTKAIWAVDEEHHLSQATQIDPHQVYWVHLQGPSITLNIVGSIDDSKPKMPPLRAGWNLAGFANTLDPIAESHAFCPDSVEGPVQYWDRGFRNTRDPLKPGLGYWIHSNSSVPSCF